MGALARQGGIATKGGAMTDREDREGGFLRNWSRRKLAAKREQSVLPDEPATPVDAADPSLPEEEIDEQAIIDALPSLDEITAGFDIKPFLAKGVPAPLKNAALRKLWMVSPAVRDYSDPAVDYAWDWNAPGGVPGGGGVLSSQSVEKMVRDLIGDRAEPPTDGAESGLAVEPVRPRQAAQITAREDVLETPQPAAERRDDLDADADGTDPENPQAQASDPSPRPETQPLASQRRHGGAVPE